MNTVTRSLRITEQKVLSFLDLEKILSSMEALYLNLRNEQDGCYRLFFNNKKEEEIFSIYFFHEEKNFVFLACRDFLLKDFFPRIEKLPSFNNFAERLSKFLIEDILNSLKNEGVYKF